MDVTHTNRHVSNSEKPSLLENNSGESRREMVSVGGRTKLQLLWRSQCFSLVNRTVATPPSRRRFHRQLISRNELRGWHLAVTSDTLLLQHIDPCTYTHTANARASMPPYKHGHHICIELWDGWLPIPGALFSIQVQECALIYKGWNGTRPVSQRSPVGCVHSFCRFDWVLSEYMNAKRH